MADNTKKKKKEKKRKKERKEKKLSCDLFHYEMILCVLGVYLNFSGSVGKHVLCTWELEHSDKSSVSPLGKLDSFSLKPAKKNTLENFSLHYTAMATYVSFIKETGYFPVLAGKSPDFRNSQTEGNNSYCSQH